MITHGKKNRYLAILWYGRYRAATTRTIKRKVVLGKIFGVSLKLEVNILGWPFAYVGDCDI